MLELCNKYENRKCHTNDSFVFLFLNLCDANLFFPSRGATAFNISLLHDSISSNRHTHLLLPLTRYIIAFPSELMNVEITVIQLPDTEIFLSCDCKLSLLDHYHGNVFFFYLIVQKPGKQIHEKLPISVFCFSLYPRNNRIISYH